MVRIIFSFLCGLSLLPTAGAHNRLATVDDQQQYGTYIQPGDLIIDTPTKVVDGKPEVVYYFMNKQWPALREGANIWLDGQALGPLSQIKFSSTSDALVPWHIEAATFRNIPNTQVVTRSFSCQGLKHFKLNGISEQFPGIAALGYGKKFLTRSFGFHCIGSLKGGHGMNINVIDGGSIELQGFEIQYGFSGLRINGGNEAIRISSVRISNFYIHDTITGEGIYLGATHAPPYAVFNNLEIFYGIICRTAAEALQLQHLAGGSDVRHLTIFAADVRWMNEFRAGQDTGIQWNVDEGDNRMHHIIIDGFASVGLIPFSTGVPGKGGTSSVTDLLFNNGIDTGIYFHRSMSSGMMWTFNKLFFRGFNDQHYRRTGRPFRDYILSPRNGTDGINLGKFFFDASKSALHHHKSSLTAENIQTEIPAPEYINHGFYNGDGSIRQWAPHIAGYFPASEKGTIKVKTFWKENDIAIEIDDNYHFYKCIRDNGEEVPPSKSNSFIRLTWDTEGVRSDQEGWNDQAVQSDFPPDDLRLRPGNYWQEPGYGFEGNGNL